MNQRLALLLVFALLTGLGAAPSPQNQWQAKVEARLLQAARAGETEFLVILSDQADLGEARLLSAKAEKGQFVYNRLAETARRSQAGLLDWLGKQGLPHQSFWVANAVWVRGDLQSVQALAQRPEVGRLALNPQVALDAPALGSADMRGETRAAADPQTGIEWNLEQVGAPQVWAAGYTGQGAVIGGQDTGYEWDHPALIEKYRGWDGSIADHNYNWHDAIHPSSPSSFPDEQRCDFDNPAPCDDDGHGTHTMGTMVGSTPGNERQIGMAPGARWIGCRNMERGVGKPSTYLECFQWFLAPTDLQGKNPRPDLAPDVINNSWSCPPYEGCTDVLVLQQAVDNLRAAGILTVQSAGNDGMGGACATISNPAAIYDSSFTVGNTTQQDEIASTSSRGPVMVDGSGRLKPDISAPGSSIFSSYSGHSYGVLSGTSMAAPHVSGLAALLISAYPALSGQPDEIERIIERSAAHLTTQESCGGTAGLVPNNVYGWGRIDAWKALQQVWAEVGKTASADEILPGETITYTLTLTGGALLAPGTAVTLSDSIPAPAVFITATLPHTLEGQQVTWEFPELKANSTQRVELVIQAPAGFVGDVINHEYEARTADLPVISGPPVHIWAGRRFFLPLVLHDR